MIVGNILAPYTGKDAYDNGNYPSETSGVISFRTIESGSTDGKITETKEIATFSKNGLYLDKISVTGTKTGTSNNCILVGHNSSVSGNGTITIGNNNSGFGGSIVIGKGIIQTISGGSILIGSDITTNNGGTRQTCIGIDTTSGSAYTIALGSGATASGYSSIALGRGAYANEQEFAISSDITSVNYASATLVNTSDIRDKIDFKSLPYALSFLNELTPVTFLRNPRHSYISEDDLRSEIYRKYGMCKYDKNAHARGEKKGDRRIIGLKAQEVLEKVRKYYPDDNDNYMNLVYDEMYGKNIPDDVENRYSLNYQGFIPVLIKAVQELSTKLDEANNKISELENKLNKE